MSSGKLEEMRKRLEAATEGPWREVAGDEANAVYGPSSSLTWDDHNGEVFEPGDSNFIAHARQDMEDMVDTLENLRHWATILFDKSQDTGIEYGARAAYAESSKVILAVIRQGLHDYGGWGE